MRPVLANGQAPRHTDFSAAGFRTPMDELRIATRKSRLALWQASFVKAELKRRHPGLGIDLIGMTTEGDRRLDARLAKLGGKGLFIKELEAALLRGDAHLAVHSMKDLPAVLDERFKLAAIGFREDVRDAWISPHGRFDAAPAGATVGSSSLRRQAQLLAARPDLKVVPMRGNVDTRLRKLDAGEFDAIVLAVAGLTRLGWADRITEELSVDRCLPAAGQGALGIECLASDTCVNELVEPLNDAAVSRCVRAERGLSAALGADCSTPLGAYATLAGDGMKLRAVLGSADGRVLLRAAVTRPDADSAVAAVAGELRRQGAGRLLAAAAQ